MAEITAKFRCFACGVENEADFKNFEQIPHERDIVLICGGCGLGNQAELDQLRNSIENESWLPCLPFEGAEKNLPVGEIVIADGTHLYVNVNGDKITRREFILRHGCDPSIIWPRIRPNYTPISVGTFGRPKIEPIRIGGR